MLKLYYQPHTLIVEDFNNPLSPMDRSTIQTLNREIRELTDVITQMDLTDIYRTFHPNTKEYTFFSEAHRIVFKTNHIFCNKANLHRYKQIAITPCILYSITMI